MDIPANAAIAVSTRSNQALDKQEQLMMKKLVLEQDRRQDDSEKRGQSRYGRRRAALAMQGLTTFPFQRWRRRPGREASSCASLTRAEAEPSNALPPLGHHSPMPQSLPTPNTCRAAQPGRFQGARLGLPGSTAARATRGPPLARQLSARSFR
jgi:hypothetical protein